MLYLFDPGKQIQQKSLPLRTTVNIFYLICAGILPFLFAQILEEFLPGESNFKGGVYASLFCASPGLYTCGHARTVKKPAESQYSYYSHLNVSDSYLNVQSLINTFFNILKLYKGKLSKRQRALKL